MTSETSETEDHKHIWLQPLCQEYQSEGRLWCKDRLDACDDCGAEPVKFIREDLSVVKELQEETDQQEKDLWLMSESRTKLKEENTLLRMIKLVDCNKSIDDLEAAWSRRVTKLQAENTRLHDALQRLSEADAHEYRALALAALNGEGQ